MRLIDADALKETIDREIFRHETIDHVFQIIDDAPTIEPKRGKWIDLDDQWGFEGTFKCSACGELWSLIDGTPQDNGMNFCPNCGCDMRGKDDE